MARSEVVEFNGHRFRRYPDSPYVNHQRYYSPGHGDAAHGVEALHREIWKAANGPIPPGVHIHHVDGNPLNNDIGNLAAVTPKRHGRHHAANQRTEQHLAHLARIRPGAAAWHRSPEGRDWHREHGKAVMAAREPIDLECVVC